MTHTAPKYCASAVQITNQLQDALLRPAKVGEQSTPWGMGLEAFKLQAKWLKKSSGLTTQQAQDFWAQTFGYRNYKSVLDHSFIASPHRNTIELQYRLPSTSLVIELGTFFTQLHFKASEIAEARQRKQQIWAPPPLKEEYAILLEHVRTNQSSFQIEGLEVQDGQFEVSVFPSPIVQGPRDATQIKLEFTDVRFEDGNWIWNLFETLEREILPKVLQSRALFPKLRNTD